MTDDVLDDFREPKTYTNSEIITQIWTEPRAVFEYINKFQYDGLLVPLLFLAGIVRAFDRAVARDLGDTLPLSAIILTCVFLGGLLGWISYYFYAALISWTGKWLDGKGDTKSILRVMAYAMIPSILGLLFFTIQIVLYGEALFQAEGYLMSENAPVNILFWGALIIELALSVGTIVLTVIGVSVVQQLSIGKTLLNMLLPLLIIVIPLVLLFAGVSLL